MKRSLMKCDLHLHHLPFTIYLPVPFTGTVVAFRGTIKVYYGHIKKHESMLINSTLKYKETNAFKDT